MKQPKNNKHTIAVSEITTYTSFTILYIVWIHTLITEKLWNGHKKLFYHRGFHLHVNVRLNVMFLVIKISSKLEIQPIKGLFSDNIA